MDAAYLHLYMCVSVSRSTSNHQDSVRNNKIATVQASRHTSLQTAIP